MPGLRIHHVEAKNCTLLVLHPGEIREGMFRKINKGRKAKDYHIRLDAEGNAIVSETIWKRLQESGFGGRFILLNEVADPPAITISTQQGAVKIPAIFRELGSRIEPVESPQVREYKNG